MALTFAVGDIHGERAKMDMLLMKIESQADGGTVVFIGDYVDRGPDSAGVLQRLIEGPPSGWTWIALKGNHEIMMLEGVSDTASADEAKLWLTNGGEATQASYPDGRISQDHLDYVRGLHFLHRDKHRIYGHAFYDVDVPYEEQVADTVLWERWSAFDTLKQIAPWHFVHGHTPRSSNPTTRGNRTNIDSGAVFGGPLSAAVFDDDRSGPPVDLIQTQ
ncbi:hypothetical protein B7H23_10730 [Notoacmeibacter marinus]|uniref:Calcineurin-like phosphoesterase domain-containing protein n=1 Tax=Notoacmeibacter marinus TaxID=1876515 RepID=A0A231UXG4_9HYPH|nr:metallophosphoesterase [Notoacmeibacter marinus]OXT00572.1 hypothetical protein B7H23_10730 [Notoacmeibacter marinus]